MIIVKPCAEDVSAQPIELHRHTCRRGAAKPGPQHTLRPDARETNSFCVWKPPPPSQDLATQLFHWDFYQSSCRKLKMPRGKFLAPHVAEFLTGPGVMYCVCTVTASQILVGAFSLRPSSRLDVTGTWSRFTPRISQTVPPSAARGLVVFLKQALQIQNHQLFAIQAWCQVQACQSEKLKGLPLFSGIAALELGLSEPHP